MNENVKLVDINDIDKFYLVNDTQYWGIMITDKEKFDKTVETIKNN